MDSILEYLKLKPLLQSTDYINNKKQFHLYTLLTEQRHPKTRTLSSTIRESTKEGLKMLLSVDEDITNRIEELIRNPEPAEQAVEAVCRAIRENRKIYFYGCGSTGRLAKMMESTLWRPFWRKIKKSPVWEKLAGKIPEDIDDRLIGEMTGADRALISSLEGFEDLQLIGRLQLADRRIEKGDVVFCVTEGGETSSVIGTILAALGHYGEINEAKAAESSRNLYFVYNNPDHLLLPFDRSRIVLENRGITKLNLTTGPQSITGSTRMQATTSEIYIMGSILEEALFRTLQGYLGPDELLLLGFTRGTDLNGRLAGFRAVKESVDNTLGHLVGFTDCETDTYRKGRFSTYIAGDSLITVFTDVTERSPTFRLFPLDTITAEKRRSWIRIWTMARNQAEAWQALLGRSFRGLAESFYKPSFEKEINDPYLKKVALKSLGSAGNDQEKLYDLSLSETNKAQFDFHPDDLGVIVCVDEECAEVGNPGSGFSDFMKLYRDSGAKIAVISVGDRQEKSVTGQNDNEINIHISLPEYPDPIGLRKQIALKMLLNAHSTAIMAKLGRVIGNTMTTVNPSNLKLIGRATYLIMSHVNDAISSGCRKDLFGNTAKITFEEANAVLYDAIDYVAERNAGETAEVALSIIRIIEALKNRAYVSWEQAQSILDSEGLDLYLMNNNPGLK